MKEYIKKALICLGLRNPAAGIKLTGQRKIDILLSYKGDRDIFIETGTNKAETTEAMKKLFSEVYSIELDEEKYKRAVGLFADAPHVHFYLGDSAVQIYEVMKAVTRPALIWLDAHGAPFNLDNSPVREELDAIFTHPVKGHAIVIDDARHFTVSDLREIKTFAQKYKYTYVNEEGLLRLTPNNFSS